MLEKLFVWPIWKSSISSHVLASLPEFISELPFTSGKNSDFRSLWYAAFLTCILEWQVFVQYFNLSQKEVVTWQHHFTSCIILQWHSSACWSVSVKSRQSLLSCCPDFLFPFSFITMVFLSPSSHLIFLVLHRVEWTFYRCFIWQDMFAYMHSRSIFDPVV